MISPERLDGLQRSWIQTTAEFGADFATLYVHFDALVAAYSAPPRAYHTLEHLTEMFRVAGRLRIYSENWPAVIFSIWFHDVVQDPVRNDPAADVAESAEWAKTTLQAIQAPAVLGEAVAKLILTTRHDQPGVPLAVGETSDEAVLADADLAILGAAPSRYDRYVQGIRQEYAHVSDDAFQRGRAAWIDLWSQRKCLYRTPALREVGEAAARENLARERSGYR